MFPFKCLTAEVKVLLVLCDPMYIYYGQGGLQKEHVIRNYVNYVTM